MPGTRTIKVDYMARVEGEGSLYMRLSGNRATEVKLTIFEPPRLFEGFLEGRSYLEVPDITARICGICPVAYQMSSVHAFEKLMDVALEPGIGQLRRLLYCGEWIESHALHIYLLHAPDFLGFQDAIRMAEDHKERVQAGLALKKTGNDVMVLLGGREIHPVNVRVGGFYRTPAKSELQALRPALERALEIAVETVHWVAAFDFPDFEQDYEFVALHHPEEYAMNHGRIVSSRGLDIAVEDYLDYFVERQVAYSNALHSVLRSRGSYLVGPLARFQINYGQLTPAVHSLAERYGLAGGCRNPFRSIVVRALETVYACEEALRLIDCYEPPAKPYQQAPPRPGACAHATEAPRGILVHRYEIGESGLVSAARVVPPTAQNQKRIEEDLCALAPVIADLNLQAITHRCEQMVRSYDPCISCATHHLNVRIERT